MNDDDCDKEAKRRMRRRPKGVRAFVVAVSIEALPVYVPTPEPICTGYNASEAGNLKYYKTFTDCVALRSPTCLDGRCTYHCRDMCNCDGTGAKPKPVPRTPDVPKTKPALAVVPAKKPGNAE